MFSAHLVAHHSYIYVVRWTMAPKANLGLQRVQHSSASESTASIWARLAPTWASTNWAAHSTTWDWGWERGSWSRWSWHDHHHNYDSHSHRRTNNGHSRYDPYNHRHDTTTVRHLRRGTTADALAALQASGVTALVESLVADRYSATGAASIKSLVRTWAHFHNEAFGHYDTPPPVLPITVQALVVIGSLFKAGGYRSYANYVSAIKAEHIEAGHPWDEIIAHTSSWVTRSVLRGIGPARQSCGFNFERLRLLPRQHDPLTELGPHNPMHLALLASMFLLRELEVTTARTSAWTFTSDPPEIAWLLPSSKSDHLALGVTRSWPCLCGIPTVPCPYHLALEHIEWLRSSDFSDDPDAPLFPTVNGTVAGKSAVVTTFERLGEMCLQPLVSDTGLRLFGGHTTRVTGAVLWAVHGIEINKIRILARHSGDTILRYVSTAPLRTLRTDLGLPPQGAAIPDGGILRQPSTTNGSTSPETLARFQALEATVAGLTDMLETRAAELRAELSNAIGTRHQRTYVQNLATSTVHLVRHHDRSDNRAVCGWQFRGDTARARRRIVREITFRFLTDIATIPGQMLCERCLPNERELAIAANLVQDDLSGDE